jgi:hypothetical protein
MPSLAQMFKNCHHASYYSRDDAEVYAKLNEAGFEVYCAVLKEFSGFFIKFDETSLSLTATQANQEYTLPADVGQIVHLAERPTSTENWHPMSPATNLENVLINQLVSFGLFSFGDYGNGSPFSYYGPFLDSAGSTPAAASQIQKIRIAPITDQTRFVQLVYTAKWIQIVNANSLCMMPDEGTYAMEARATAKLLRLNGDTLAAQFDAQAIQMEQRFMNWIRLRQIQEPPCVQTFTDW